MTDKVPDLKVPGARDVDLVIDSLSGMDRKLLLGECSGWGSWMWDSGSYMVMLGLGTKQQGNIQFDTPLAKAVIERLRALTNTKDMERG